MAQALSTVAPATIMTLPILESINQVGEVRRDVSEYVKLLLGKAGDMAVAVGRETADVSKSIASKAPDALRELGRYAEEAGKVLYRVGRLSLRTFQYILTRMDGSFASVITAIMVYRLVDWSVNLDPNSAVQTLDGFKRGLESLRVSLPTLTPPELDATPIVNSIQSLKTQVRVIFGNMKTVLPAPSQPSRVSFGCVAPEWYDLVGWLRYGFCTLGEAIINGLVTLGYYLYSAIYWLWDMLMSGLQWLAERLLDIVATITTWLVSLVNIILKGIFTLGNWFLRGVELLANTVFDWLIKKPLGFIIDYIVKPVVVMVANGFNWLKSQIKTLVCDYLRVSPYITGFATTYTMLEKEARKRGFTGALRTAFRSAFGFLFFGLGSFVVTEMMVATLVPECSLTPGATPAVPSPQPPSALSAVRMPVEYYAELSATMVTYESASSRYSPIYTSVISLGLYTTESTSTRSTTVYNATASIGLTTGEATSQAVG